MDVATSSCEPFAVAGANAYRWSGENVHLWRADLHHDSAVLEPLMDLLSADEKSTAARFHFERDRQRSIAARGTLRLLLANYLETEPCSLEFIYGEHGKPSLAAPHDGLYFNVSHSRNVAVYAIARCPVGVDIEYSEAKPTLGRLVDRLFSPTDAQAWTRLPADQQVAMFYKSWTWKEAYLKATGRGFAGSRDGFTLQLASDASLQVPAPWAAPDEDRKWSFRHFSPAAGYVAAVAIQAAFCNAKFTLWK